MAVETKYVVVRKGEEKMTFANKKDADAWDKMLDMADAFTDWLQQHQPELGEAQAEALGMLLAEQKDAVQHILRNSKLPDAVKEDATAEVETEASVESEPSAESEASAEADTGKPEKKVRAVKAA
ncbi:DNA damage-inducible SOS regulon protein [Pantoea sp. Seng]|uniref:YebG family protein n=1 Tax=Pantoea sp. Seng TaxID=2576761 RepID=UPI001326D42A|nr:YebG family protein [Pantoea sp. Seng]MXP55577.1 DNA damage-inducible SOS regulon protein [Pantoea sp. Seng]